MEDEEFSAWEDSGYIRLGLQYLDWDTANILFLALLKLFEICSERYFFEAPAKESKDGAKSRKDYVASMAKSLIDEEKRVFEICMGKTYCLWLRTSNPLIVIEKTAVMIKRGLNRKLYPTRRKSENENRNKIKKLYFIVVLLEVGHISIFFLIFFFFLLFLLRHQQQENRFCYFSHCYLLIFCRKT